MLYHKTKLGVLFQGDCLEIMKMLPDKSIDLILCDLPYQTTGCSWDTIIPFEPLWKQYNRVLKPESPVVLTASQPFTTKLINSNLDNFKYSWVWEKEQGVNFQLCKYQPLKIHEDICVFSSDRHNYYPQGLIRIDKKKSNKSKGGRLGHNTSEVLRDSYIQEYSNYPKSIIKCNREVGYHPTQKPVELMEYLISTYTIEGQVVMDNTCGSGSTLIACENLNRRYIGIEKETKYCDIVKTRLQELK